MKTQKLTGLTFCAAAVLTASIWASGAIAADTAFSGEDAAYIDWAWSNCKVASTTKEHQLADAAQAKLGSALNKTYQTWKAKIAGTTKSSDARTRLCASISGWYGEGGTRISDLIQDRKETRSSEVGLAATPTDSPAKSGRKHGGRRSGGQGNQ